MLGVGAGTVADIETLSWILRVCPYLTKSTHAHIQDGIEASDWNTPCWSYFGNARTGVLCMFLRNLI